MSPLQRASVLAIAALALSACATTKPGPGGSGGSAGNSPTKGSQGGVPAVAEAPSASAGSAAPENGTTSSATRAGGTGIGAGSAVPPTAQTSDERRAAIDRQLNQSLGTFDSELRKEQERVAKERDERVASSAGTSDTEEETDEEKDGDGSGGSADAEGLPGSDADEKDADGKRPGDLKSERDTKGGASAGRGGNGAGATEIPDGSDDDIVARRLRKAAEQETDPELKEKLWKEYIEYKKNQQK